MQTLAIVLIIIAVYFILSYIISERKESKVKELDRLTILDSSNSLETLKNAANDYLSHRKGYIMNPNPETTEAALELLNTLYVNYINDLSPYRVRHLDFFQFASNHDALHLFDSMYSSHKLTCHNRDLEPSPLHAFIILQTP